MMQEQIALFVAEEDISLVDAMQKIDDNTVGVLFLINQKEQLCGAVSDGDIRRWILKKGDIHCKVSQVMNPSPKYLLQGNVGNYYEILTSLHIPVMPVVDDHMHIVDLLFSREKEIHLRQKRSVLANTPVVVMAGGKGTRLYPYTKILPKPLIPIGDIPIVERILDHFYEYGVKNFYMTVNYRKEMIRSYFADVKKEYGISFVEEEQPLGTAGSIRLIPDKFHTPFVVTNCDILIRTDYEELYRYHKESGNQITMVTALKHNEIPYGVVYADDKGVVERLEEKPQSAYFVNTGMYILEPEMISYIPENSFFHMTDLIDQVMKDGKKVGMYPVREDAFLDMGEFEEMKRMEGKLQVN